MIASFLSPLLPSVVDDTALGHLRGTQFDAVFFEDGRGNVAVV